MAIPELGISEDQVDALMAEFLERMNNFVVGEHEALREAHDANIATNILLNGMVDATVQTYHKAMSEGFASGPVPLSVIRERVLFHIGACFDAKYITKETTYAQMPGVQ